MEYIKLSIQCSAEQAEILMAELGELGYEAFEEVADGIEAYICTDIFAEEAVLQLQMRYAAHLPFSYHHTTIAPQNWNVVWESNFEPVFIGDAVVVKSSFHQITKTYPYTIEITPKMAFGTGHHETTALILEWMTELDFEHKTVLDAGCGTGILAIMAHLCGASLIEAYDTDEWAVNNSRENFCLNHCEHIYLQQGTIRTVQLAPQYDWILANIQKNVLLEEMGDYARHLSAGGGLILSGILVEDVADIQLAAHAQGLRHQSSRSKGNWAAAYFRKA